MILRDLKGTKVMDYNAPDLICARLSNLQLQGVNLAGRKPLLNYLVALATCVLFLTDTAFAKDYGDRNTNGFFGLAPFPWPLLIAVAAIYLVFATFNYQITTGGYLILISLNASLLEAAYFKPMTLPLLQCFLADLVSVLIAFPLYYIICLRPKWTIGLDMTGADLSGSDLTGADLISINLPSARLHQAILRNACLREGNLKYSDLTAADLSGCDLRFCDMKFADLRGANLTGTRFDHALIKGIDLRGANLTHSNIVKCNLSAATYDETTIWPAGFELSNTRG